MKQDIFDENKLKFINSTLLLRGVSKTPLIVYLNNIKQIVEAKITSGRNYLPTDFGDINKNQLDPSVRFALLSVGLKLMENQCLTPTELTYYFTKWRYNKLTNKQTNKPILLQKTFQILIESKLIISNIPLNILIDASIITNNAIIAEQLFEEQNNGISDDED